MEVCGETGGEEDAFGLAMRTQPNVVVLDISLLQGSGLELLKRLRVHIPDVAVIVLSMHEESVYAQRCLRLGARGYVMKTEAADQIVNAIRRVHGGGFHLSTVLQATLQHQIERRAIIEAPLVALLSRRELEIFHLSGKGLAVHKIAAHLSVGEGTVKTHVKRIRKKLGLISTAEVWRSARHWVAEHPILPPDSQTPASSAT